jgi:ATP-dependent helicase YprA (DUF1998 family)
MKRKVIIMKLFKRKPTKEEIRQQELKALKEEREKEYKAKALINRTKRDLKKQIDKLVVEKENFLSLAKEAKNTNDKGAYLSAYAGWKIAFGIQEKANKMLIKLSITQNMKEIGDISKNFMNSMLTISKQIATTSKSFDFMDAEKDFQEAMADLTASDDALDIFLANLDTSLDDYADSNIDNINEIDNEFTNLVNQEVAKETEVQVDNKHFEKSDSSSKIDNYIKAKLNDLKERE